MKGVKQRQLEALEAEVRRLHDKWDLLKQGLDDKIKSCVAMHRKHNREAEDYQQKISENLDNAKLAQKLARLSTSQQSQ